MSERTWFDVCAVDDIPLNCGVAALIAGRQVALVRVALVPGEPDMQKAEGHLEAGDRERVYALSNYDPFSEAFVIARGIVGDRDGCPKIASPMYKESFDLRTGICLDDPSVVLSTYAVRVRDGRIHVAFELEREPNAQAE